MMSVKKSVGSSIKKFGAVDVAVSVCEELSYGGTSPNCARTSSRPLGEKSTAIAVIVSPLTSAESRDLFSNERRSPHISPDAARAYPAIQRTQAIQVIQVTQMIQTSLEVY